VARLKRIELQGFRGFANKRELDLDADVVLIRGDNGTGKTSLVDGLLWLFTGDLPYLAERVKGLRKPEDVVASRFGDVEAVVSLVVGGKSRDVTFSRRGNQKVNRLLADRGNGPPLEGLAAEAELASAFESPDVEQLAGAVASWGLLRQDAVASTLEGGAPLLYQRIAGLIGLETVNGFAEAATEAATALGRERTQAKKGMERVTSRHEQAAARRGLARRAMVDHSDLDEIAVDGLREIEAMLPVGVALPPPANRNQELLEGLGDAARRLHRAFEGLGVRWRELGQHPKDAAEAVARAEERAVACRNSAAAAVVAAPAIVQLSSSALDLLGDRCPVCGQEIDEESVRVHLEELLAQSQDLVARSREAQDALVAAEVSLTDARVALDNRSAAERRVRRAEEDVQETARSIKDHLRLTADDLSEEAGVRRMAVGLQTTIGLIADVEQSLNRASGPRVTRLSEELEAAAVERRSAESDLASLERRYKDAKAVEKAAHDAAKAILGDALVLLEPSFAEVFDRLMPSPAFTELRAKQDVMRNRNQIIPLVCDPERGIEANPQIVFSEGQLNIVALSYFLGVALNARDASLPFLVLDDPLQSFDVIAILGFSDLCRRLRSHRQLIVTTHDRRFADVLTRKLSPREDDESLVVHDFAGWDREGPTVSTVRPLAGPVLRIVGAAEPA
jgi:hypothetical protein